jgi:uncharacterized protein YndB with AHSA1/START domain
MSNEHTGPFDVVSTRVFPVSRERLFEAFSDPQQLTHWWGPKGFTNTFEEFDLRPGGTWRFTMHAPTGAEYHNSSEFMEVARPERIVFKHLRPVHDFAMTMLFTEEGGGTRLTWRMKFDTDEGEQMRAFIASANEENFDRLEAVLASRGHEIPDNIPTP